MNVEVVDKTGFKTKLVAFHRISGDTRFHGYLGAGEIDVPYENVDIHKRESRTPEFKRKNPLGSVPVLELDDGTCIAESTYFGRRAARRACS